MIPDSKLKISFEAMSAKGALLIAQQPTVTYEDALRQVEWLKQNSKVTQSSKKGTLKQKP